MATVYRLRTEDCPKSYITGDGGDDGVTFNIGTGCACHHPEWCADDPAVGCDECRDLHPPLRYERVPDTPNTPHAIAAAVLGMSESDLRRRLLVGGRVLNAEWDDHADAYRLSGFWLSEWVVEALTRPEDDR